MHAKHSCNELESLNRALRMLSGCNHALLRADDESAFLQEICRVVVEEAGYRMAWVGRAEQDETKAVMPVAHAGIDKDLVDSFNFTWAETARGDTLGSVIRTGCPRVIRDLQNDADLAQIIQRDSTIAALREEAVRRGYGSVLVLPLRVDSEAFGVISIGASEIDAFGDKEMKLLSEAAEDLAFGIETLRMKCRRRQAELEILRLNRALRTRAGVAHAVTQALDETVLLGEICRLVVEDCGYGVAWIGYVNNDAANTMLLMAHAGFDASFLALELAEGTLEIARGFAPVLETDPPRVLRDIRVLDPPIREEAIRRGYQSAIILPWRADDGLTGVLHILATEADAFDSQEVESLAAATRDLGFGIAALHTRARAVRAEETIRRMAYCDSLTGLPNRVRLHELLEEAAVEKRTK